MQRKRVRERKQLLYIMGTEKLLRIPRCETHWPGDAMTWSNSEFLRRYKKSCKASYL